MLSHEKVQELVEKRVKLLSFIAILSTVVVAIFSIITNGKLNNVEYTRNILVIWYIWIVMLAILGFARKRLNKESVFTKYMAKTSYGLLIVHYPILLLLCIVIPPMGLPMILTHLLIIVLEVILSFVVHELLKRIPIVRFCVFGYRKKASQKSTISACR